MHGSSMISFGISSEMGLHGDDFCSLFLLGICPADSDPFGSVSWLIPADLELVGWPEVPNGMLPKTKGGKEEGGVGPPPVLCMDRIRLWLRCRADRFR